MEHESRPRACPSLRTNQSLLVSVMVSLPIPSPSSSPQPQATGSEGQESFARWQAAELPRGNTLRAGFGSAQSLTQKRALCRWLNRRSRLISSASVGVHVQFLRKCQDVFPGAGAMLHRHQQRASEPFSWHLHQHLVRLLLFLFDTHCGFSLHFPNS